MAQSSLFTDSLDCSSSAPDFFSLPDILLRAREIYEEAVARYQPYAVVLLFSGGQDSTALLSVVHQLGLHVDFVMHLNTGTGVPAAREFVLSQSALVPYRFHLEDAGSVYVDTVLSRGFFGLGLRSHARSFHMLKHNPLVHALSVLIRQRRHGRKILLLTGARMAESVRRSVTAASPFRVERSNIWCSLIHHMPNEMVLPSISAGGLERSPVYGVLCKSGECLCGTLCNRSEELSALKEFDPIHFKWITGLEREVLSRGFRYGWGMPIPNSEFTPAQLQLFEAPELCTSCVSNFSPSLVNP